MSADSTIPQLLDAGNDAATAIAAPAVRPLTYGELRDQVRSTVEALNGFGVGRNDRVAIVMPNRARDGDGICLHCRRQLSRSPEPGLPDRGIRILSHPTLVPRLWSLSRAVNRRRDPLRSSWNPGAGAENEGCAREPAPGLHPAPSVCSVQAHQLGRVRARPMMSHSCCILRARLPGRSWCR